MIKFKKFEEKFEENRFYFIFVKKQMDEFA